MSSITGKVALLMLIVFALLSNLHLFRQTRDFAPKTIGRDEITLYEKRFEGLKKMLPPHGVVGYLSNKRVEDIRFDATAAEYYLTQYALTPLVVVYSPNYPLVVGNFRQAVIDPQIYTSRDLVPLKDFGNGVMLFRREKK